MDSKCGAPIGNTNALIHGKYSKQLNLAYKNRLSGAQPKNKNAIKKGVWSSRLLDEKEKTIFNEWREILEAKCFDPILVDSFALAIIKFIRASKYGSDKDFFWLSSVFMSSIKNIKKYIRQNAPKEESSVMDVYEMG